MHPAHAPDFESRLQGAAEQPAVVPGLPPQDVDAYRQVYRAIRAAPMPEIAPDFSRSLERLTRDHDEQATPEIWILRATVFVVLAGVAASLPALGSIAAAMVPVASGFPRPLALAAGAALAAAAMIDRLVRA